MSLYFPKVGYLTPETFKDYDSQGTECWIGDLLGIGGHIVHEVIKVGCLSGVRAQVCHCRTARFRHIELSRPTSSWKTLE